MAKPPVEEVMQTDAESVALNTATVTLSASAMNASIVRWSQRPPANERVAVSDKDVFAEHQLLNTNRI